MSYLSAKKIYPGNFTEALNGWYKNIDTNDDSTNDKSSGELWKMSIFHNVSRGFHCDCLTPYSYK